MMCLIRLDASLLGARVFYLDNDVAQRIIHEVY